MGVLINEFEIVPPSEGDAGAKPDEASPQSAMDKMDEVKARDVHVLMERREQRRARVLAH